MKCLPTYFGQQFSTSITDFPTTGRGASALFDLGFAETIIEVPVDLIITESTFNESEMVYYESYLCIHQKSEWY